MKRLTLTIVSPLFLSCQSSLTKKGVFTVTVETHTPLSENGAEVGMEKSEIREWKSN
ncbi:MAG: hypothetical protein LBG05_02470 [Treponema sp.]|jgi:hypothetical protein|nr:hypothetical protein [Treponema sp.]